MSAAFIPIWILGAPVVGLLILSMIYKGGSSTSTANEYRALA